MAVSATLLRQWQLLTLLSAPNGQATVRQLVERSGVCDKTVRRDLELLKEVGFPLVEVVGERGRKHWQLANDSGIAQLRFTLEEAAALYLGRQFLEPLAGTYFFAGAQSAFEKIRATLGAAALKHLEKLAAAFYHKSHGWADYSQQGELIDDLQRAIEDRRLTVVTYQSLRSTEPVTYYDLHPYGLAWHKHALYLIAWSLDHQAIRTFKVDRISSVETERLQFKRPADFDLQDYLAHSFGIIQSDEPPRRVVVRFAPAVARILEEKRFHPSQKLTSESTGHVLASYQLSSFEEFQSFVLSFGPLAEVLEPADLRDRLITSLRDSLANYTRTPAAAPVASRPSVRKAQ